MSAMSPTDRRRGLRKSPLGLPLSLRLPEHLRTYVALRSEMDDCAIADVIRQALEDALDREPPVLQDIGPGFEALEHEHAVPLRTIVGLVDAESAPELAAKLRAAESGAEGPSASADDRS